MSERTHAGFLQVLANKRFRNLWIGQAVSEVGDYFYLLAVPILINDLTGSTWAVGLATLFTVTLPGLLFSIPAGALVDRWDRRNVMIVTDLSRAVLVLGGFLVWDAESAQILWVTGFLAAAARCFFFPAHSALLPLLVSEDELPSANGLSQVTSTIAWALGPALAGLTIAWLGAHSAFVVDSATFLFSAFAIWSIGKIAGVKPAGRDGKALASLWSDIAAGLLFLKVRELKSQPAVQIGQIS